MIRPLGVQRRLLVALSVYALAVLGFGGVLFYERARVHLETELGAKLIAVGSVVTAGISEDQRQVLVSLRGRGGRTSKAIGQELARFRDASGLFRLYVFHRDGTALADADEREPGTTYPELQFELDALDEVFSGRESVSHLFTGRDGQVYKAAYLPLPVAGETEAALAVVGSATFLDTISTFRSALILAAVLGLIGSVVLSLVLARTIVSPIRRLVAAADRIRAGDLETPVPSMKGDEIGYLARTLERMRAAVLARERSLRAMLGGVAHEIRNPLGGIELFAGLLERRVADDEKAAESVDRILHEVHHLESIIKDFLDYARPVDPNLEVFAVADVAHEVGEVLGAKIAEAGVTYEVDCAGVSVLADRAQFRQILSNLVQNAVQALEGDQGHRRVVVDGSTDADTTTVSVNDNGPGIDPAIRERVFEPFFTTRQQGSGLGLSIARDLVERNGGALEIRSRPGRGTSIVMTWSAPRDKRGDAA